MDTVDRIFELLDSSGMGQKTFAKIIGATPSIVSQWKNCLSKSYKNYLPKIAEVLGTTVDYLLTGAEKEPTTVPGDGHTEEFMKLYRSLPPDKQEVIVAAMKGFQLGK